ncbi:cytochrome c1 [Aidingimonas halophila]|uniref:Ubiquinol-cytochrome c reductase cytochrome c1 subunit n=1 Tax=Aidingimonas halophila TaxID=574349 RepID=A0A1H2QUU6_9GAMM|nr:cytochrome c1 [Aidingimonas halophila]GHC20223.1 cytochrome c [Aidingimonas halophila]SDW10911.1 ubiquinol-cytochrome c reductase cytochrome c1 subunit [Aidingimonas halophila]
MKKQLFALLFALVPLVGVAAPSSDLPYSMTPDLEDKASLQNGMKLYVNYCLGCHSLEYQRFSRAASDLDMPQDLVEDNLIFSSDLLFNDQMHIAMDKGDAENWFGAPPPDLTLHSRLRGTDWIYSYLLTFYKDEDQPTGVNNEVFDMVAMPNVLEPLQGVQEKVCPEDEDASGDGSCDVLQVTEPGEMEPEEFEEAVYDLTNFLAYVGEPSKLQANTLGPKVLIFLFIFGVIAYLLKREYWRDVH